MNFSVFENRFSRLVEMVLVFHVKVGRKRRWIRRPGDNLLVGKFPMHLPKSGFYVFRRYARENAQSILPRSVSFLVCDDLSSRTVRKPYAFAYRTFPTFRPQRWLVHGGAKSYHIVFFWFFD